MADLHVDEAPRLLRHVLIQDKGERPIGHPNDPDTFVNFYLSAHKNERLLASN